MSNEAKRSDVAHTPVPYAVEYETHRATRAGPARVTARIVAKPDGVALTVCEMGALSENDPDAEFIARACNAHEGMVAAILKAQSDLEHGDLESVKVCLAAALKKAGVR